MQITIMLTRLVNLWADHLKMSVGDSLLPCIPLPMTSETGGRRGEWRIDRQGWTGTTMHDLSMTNTNGRGETRVTGMRVQIVTPTMSIALQVEGTQVHLMLHKTMIEVMTITTV